MVGKRQKSGHSGIICGKLRTLVASTSASELDLTRKKNLQTHITTPTSEVQKLCLQSSFIVVEASIYLKPVRRLAGGSFTSTVLVPGNDGRSTAMPNSLRDPSDQRRYLFAGLAALLALITLYVRFRGELPNYLDNPFGWWLAIALIQSIVGFVQHSIRVYRQYMRP